MQMEPYKKYKIASVMFDSSCSSSDLTGFYIEFK